MYRITAINNEPDTDEEDCPQVTQEAEVSVFMTITSININFQYPNLIIDIKLMINAIFVIFPSSENVFDDACNC